MPLWFRVVRLWLPIAVAVTALSALTYLAVQQSYRNGLDDPQVQLAQDGAARLDAGALPTSLVGSSTIEVQDSLAPFVAVFGADDALLASGATIAAMPPKPPTGVLATARSAGRDRVTWQPRPGVRIASVSFAAKDGRVVLAGRNMREVEVRIDDLTKITALAWVAALVAVFVAVLGIEWFGARPTRKEADAR